MTCKVNVRMKKITIQILLFGFMISPIQSLVSSANSSGRSTSAMTDDEFTKQLKHDINAGKIVVREEDKNSEIFKLLNYLDSDQIVKSQPIDSMEFIQSYLDNEDALIHDVHNFWAEHTHHIVKLLEFKQLTIGSSDYKILEHAVTLGKALQQQQLLELFDIHYNVLGAVIDEIASIQDGSKVRKQADLSQLKDDAHACITSLLDQTRLHSQLQLQYQQSALKNITKPESIARLKHTLLEKNGASVLRIHPHEEIKEFLKNKDDKATVMRNLKNYESVSNVRGEGNCGYRAFLGSICMNGIALHDMQGIDRLQQLTDNQLIPLFSKYAGENNNSLKLSVNKKKLRLTADNLKAIKQSMLRNFHRIKASREPEEIAQLFNSHPEFDFYMIMFLRTLVSEELLRDADLRVNNAIPGRVYEDGVFMRRVKGTESEAQIAEMYLNYQLELGMYIDQPELRALQQATNIDINLINESATLNPEVHIPYGSAQPERALQADILYNGTDHYKILHPKFSGLKK